MNKYVLYTNNPSSIDSQFALLSDIGKDSYISERLNDLQISESGSHRLCVFSAHKKCFDDLCLPLNDVEFLGCAHGECNSCCRETPSEHFTEDDWAKVDLANARELFNN